MLKIWELIDKDQTVSHHNKVALSQLTDYLVYVHTLFYPPFLNPQINSNSPKIQLY